MSVLLFCVWQGMRAIHAAMRRAGRVVLEREARAQLPSFRDACSSTLSGGRELAMAFLVSSSSSSSVLPSGSMGGCTTIFIRPLPGRMGISALAGKTWSFPRSVTGTIFAPVLREIVKAPPLKLRSLPAAVIGVSISPSKAQKMGLHAKQPAVKVRVLGLGPWGFGFKVQPGVWEAAYHPGCGFPLER